MVYAVYLEHSAALNPSHQTHTVAVTLAVSLMGEVKASSIPSPYIQVLGVLIPIGPLAVPFYVLYLESYNVITKRNYLGANG